MREDKVKTSKKANRELTGQNEQVGEREGEKEKEINRKEQYMHNRQSLVNWRSARRTN